MGNKKTNGLEIGNFGINLYQIRNEKGITHEALAEMIDVSSRVVYDWENGVKYPSLPNLVKIANALEIPLDSIFH